MDQPNPEPVARVTPYEGTGDYIFISCSHRDTATVLPLLQRIQGRGIPFPVRRGYRPGSERPESIAAHLGGCRVCPAFMSPASLASRNCRREINFALSKNEELDGLPQARPGLLKYYDYENVLRLFGPEQLP